MLLIGISFHAVVVFGLGKNLLFKFILGRCVWAVEHFFHHFWVGATANPPIYFLERVAFNDFFVTVVEYVERTGTMM